MSVFVQEASSGGSSLDTRLLQRLERFDGTENHWRDWAFTFEAYLIATGLMSVQTPSNIKDSVKTIPQNSVAEEHRQANKNVYYSLAFLCSGKALNVLRQSPDGHGAEAYRLLLHRFDRRDIQSTSGLLQMILGFTMGSDLAQVKDKLAELGASVGRYNAQSLDELPDGIYKAVIIKGSPEPLKTHLQVNHRESHTVTDIQGMVEGFVDDQSTKSAESSHKLSEQAKGATKYKQYFRATSRASQGM